MSQEQPENYSQLELEKKLIESESAIEIKRIDRAFKLLERALINGKKTVYTAFGTFGVVFILSFYTHLIHDKTFMSSQEVLWLGVMLCATLITYYGFVFGYTLSIVADLREKFFKFRAENTSKKVSKKSDLDK